MELLNAEATHLLILYLAALVLAEPIFMGVFTQANRSTSDKPLQLRQPGTVSKWLMKS